MLTARFRAIVDKKRTLVRTTVEVAKTQVRTFTPLFEAPKNGRLFFFVKPLGELVPELLMQHWSYQLGTLRAGATILKPQFGRWMG